MFARALVLTALVAAAAAVKVDKKFFSPSDALKKSVPGGVYEPVNVNSKFYVSQNDNQSPEETLQATAAESYCPEIVFFSNTSIQWQQHDETCVVQYSAITWDGSNPRVQYDQEVTGTLALATNSLFDIIFQGAPKNFAPLKCIVNIAGNTYEVAQPMPDTLGEPSPDTRRLLTFTNIMSRCQQYFFCFSPTLGTNDSSTQLASQTCLPTISQTRQATPIGPMSISQKANGQYLFTTAFMYSGLKMDINEFIEEECDFEGVPSNVNINNGKNPENYNLYNFRVWIAQGTFNAVEVDTQGNALTLYAVGPQIMRFKPRDSVFATADDVLDYNQLDPGLEVFTYGIEFFQESFTGRQLMGLYTLTALSQNAFGTDGLSSGLIDATYEKSYLYQLVSQPVSSTQFQKNMIQEWFGGAKQHYTLNNKVANDDDSALPKGITERQDIRERKRKKFRRKKRRVGKRTGFTGQNARDNLRFKLENGP